MFYSDEKTTQPFSVMAQLPVFNSFSFDVHADNHLSSAGATWQPSEQEMAFADVFLEMQGLLGGVQGSIGRLEALGGTLRKCVAHSPSSAPPGALSLAAAAESMGQHASRPSQASSAANYPRLPAGESEFGPAYVRPSAPAAANSKLDSMISSALQQLYPAAQMGGTSKTGQQIGSSSDPRLPSYIHAAVAEEQQSQASTWERLPGLQQQQGSRLQYTQQHDNRSQHHVQAMSGGAWEQPRLEPRGQAVVEQQFDLAEGFPSLGSAGHASNMCKPCVFLYNGMCLKGTRCQFCHIPHDAEQVKRVRPSKRTRNLLRQHRDGPESEQNEKDQVSLQ